MGTGGAVATVSAILRLAAVLTAISIAAPAQTQTQTENVTNGAITCAQSGCHELASPASGANIDRNEHAIWSADPHAQAYRALQTEQARRIAANLGLGAPEAAGLCLDCHATNVPQQLRGPNFDITEGVTCEACHGGSGQWLETHDDLDYTMEDLLAQGLYPTWDPVQRAKMCLDCHFGAKDQFAGHRLMGAGHPRVSFELDSYTELNAHHTVDDDYLERKGDVDGMRTWAIGQAMSLERRMDLLADPQTGTVGLFPEFVFFDCRGCHSPMTVKRRGTVQRRGQPNLDDSNVRMLRIAASYADPSLAARIDGDIAALHRAAAQGRAPLVAAAARMRDTARAAVDAVARHEFTADEMRGVMRTLAGNALSGGHVDYASAEQLALGIESTLAAMDSRGLIDDAEYSRISAALDPVFKAVESDEGYSPPAFASAMQGFRAAIQ